ncbi:hypothetical protein BH10PSE15_BH10PSE15_12470 [soil metagenome]
MVGEAAWRALAHEALHRRSPGRSGLRQPLVLGGCFFQFDEGELHLVDEALTALRPRAIHGAPHLLGLEFQQGVTREQIGVFGAGIGQFSLDFQRACHSGGGHFPGPRKLFPELV